MAKRKRHAIPKTVGDVLKRVYPAPKQLRSARVFAWWNRAVPERIVKNARPVKLRRGRLTVHVTSSIWANELHYLSQDLLERIQAFAPDVGVKEIRFQIGALPELVKRARPVPVSPLKPIELDAMPEDLGRALGRLSDNTLRDVIARAAQAGLSRNPGK